MPHTEDNGAVNTTDAAEDTTLTNVEDSNKTEEPQDNSIEPKTNTNDSVTTDSEVKSEEVEDEEIDDFSDLDAVLDSLLEEDEDSSEDSEKPTEPTFFNKEEDKVDDKKEDESTDEPKAITEEDLNELDESFRELETELEESKENEKKLQTSLDESERNMKAYSNALDLLGEHPILWPLNEKLLKGEEVDIPKYLQDKVEEEINSLPNMDNIANEPTGTKPPVSLQDKLVIKAKQRH